MFVGPCIVNVFQYISNKMQLYTVCALLMIDGGTTPKDVEQFPDTNKLCKVASC
jgi:hypothetical protein